MKTATFRNSWGLVFPFSSQSVIPPEGRSRPVAAKGGLRPGVYAGWGLGSNPSLFYFSALSASFTRLLPSPRRPVNGPDKSKKHKKKRFSSAGNPA
jgi:hypothetical protein